MTNPIPSEDQAKQVAQVVRDYFRAHDAGDSRRLRKAFYPGTVTFSVVDGELYGVTQRQWWAQLDASTSSRPAESRDIVHIDVDGSLALVKTASRWPALERHEYLLLLRRAPGWSIVAQVSHRRDASAPHAAEDDRERMTAATETVQAKIDSHWTYDAEALGASHDPRAMYYTLVEGTLVADSVAEWQRRYEQERRAGRRPVAADWRPTWVDAVGDAAGAKAVLETDTGTRVIDYFVLLRVGGAWRIVDVTWVVASPSP